MCPAKDSCLKLLPNISQSTQSIVYFVEVVVGFHQFLKINWRLETCLNSAFSEYIVLFFSNSCQLKAQPLLAYCAFILLLCIHEIQKKNKPIHKHQWLQLYTSWDHFRCDEAQITEEFRMIALQAELQTENNWQHKTLIMTEQTDPRTGVLWVFRKSQHGGVERICFLSSNETPFSIVWNVILCVWVYLSLSHINM